MSVLVMFPFEAPMTGFLVPDPVFGENYDLNVQVTTGHSRNGELFAYKRTPTYITQKFEFHNVPETSVYKKDGTIKSNGVDSIKDIWKQAAGRYVLIIDHKGKKWKAMIINNLNLVCEGRNGCGNIYTFTLEFEGEPA